MAKQSIDTVSQFNNIIASIAKQEFKPVYILMGEEPYYIDIILDNIIEHALTPQERDFNQTIVYATDTSADEIASLARRYPMFAPRQLIIVKEAQTLTKLESLEGYMSAPSPETILVLAYTNKSADKRTTFFKSAKKIAEVFDSTAVKEWEVYRWIINHLKESDLNIEEDAARLMAEHTGNRLRKVVLECNKLKNAIKSENAITVTDVEKNIGISREFSVFELCKSLAYRDINKALNISYHIGIDSKKHPIILTLGALFFYFSKVLKCHAYQAELRCSANSAAEKAGVTRWQSTEYVDAMRNFPINKTMGVIALLKDYDYKCKSNARGTASDGELLNELIIKILYI